MKLNSRQRKALEHRLNQVKKAIAKKPSEGLLTLVAQREICDFLLQLDDIEEIIPQSTEEDPLERI